MGASVSSIFRSPQRSLTSPHFRGTPKLPGPRQHVRSILAEQTQEPPGHGPAQDLVPQAPASSSLEQERTERQGILSLGGGGGSPIKALPFNLTQNPTQQRRLRPGEGKETQGHTVYTRTLLSPLPQPTKFSLQSVQNSSSYLSLPLSLFSFWLFQILPGCAWAGSGPRCHV